jgi:hypothetical protein
MRENLKIHKRYFVIFCFLKATSIFCGLVNVVESKRNSFAFYITTSLGHDIIDLLLNKYKTRKIGKSYLQSTLEYIIYHPNWITRNYSKK